MHMWCTRMWCAHGSGMPSDRYVHRGVHGMCLRGVVEWRLAVGGRSADESVQRSTREQDAEQLGVSRARGEM